MANSNPKDYCDCLKKGGEKCGHKRCNRGFCACYKAGRDCNEKCHFGRACKSQPDVVKMSVKERMKEKKILVEPKESE
jgi:hypothetical protein